MSRAIASTTLFVAQEAGRSLQPDDMPDELAISVITVGELRAGVLAASDTVIRTRRLATFVRELDFDPIPIDESVAEAWAHLRILLGTGACGCR